MTLGNPPPLPIAPFGRSAEPGPRPRTHPGHHDADPEVLLDEIVGSVLLRGRLDDDIAVLAVQVSDPSR